MILVANNFTFICSVNGEFISGVIILFFHLEMLECDKTLKTELGSSQDLLMALGARNEHLILYILIKYIHLNFSGTGLRQDRRGSNSTPPKCTNMNEQSEPYSPTKWKVKSNNGLFFQEGNNISRALNKICFTNAITFFPH